jgi:hypothetical protein
LNIREGLFNDEDMKQLEAGYSVSETEDDMTSAINEIISNKVSFLNSPHIGNSPPAPPRGLYDDY